MTIEKLSYSIRDNINGSKPGFSKPFESDILTVDKIDFIVFNLREFSDNYIFDFLIELREVIAGLKLDEWIAVVKKIKDDKIVLIYLISFFNRYLDIDFLNTIVQSNIITDSLLIEEITEYLETRPGLRHFSIIDKKRLKFHQIELIIFQENRNNLILQGAIPF